MIWLYRVGYVLASALDQRVARCEWYWLCQRVEWCWDRADWPAMPWRAIYDEGDNDTGE